MKKAKQTLNLIINYLINSSAYYCYNDDLLYSAADPCYCAERILQQAHDNIYCSVAEVFKGYRIDPINDLTPEALEALQEQAEQQADKQHEYFGHMSYQEALEVITDNDKLYNLLLDTYKFTAE